MRSRSRMMCLCAALSAAGLMISYLESFIVLPSGVPGIRIGLANTTTLIALYLLGGEYALIVTVVRVILSAALFGSFSSFLYSISGSLAAYAGMMLIKRFGFSVYSVSITGAVMHNTAQIAVAAAVMSGAFLFWYLPVLIFAGIIFGMITAALSSVLIKRLSNIFITKREGE